MSGSAPRMTAPMQDVLTALHAAPATPLYGLQIAQATGLAVGTVYPLLRRLVSAGWLRDDMEDPDTAAAERRPRRRYYEFTAEGRTRSLHALDAVDTRRIQARYMLGGQPGAIPLRDDGNRPC